MLTFEPYTWDAPYDDWYSFTRVHGWSPEFLRILEEDYALELQELNQHYANMLRDAQREHQQRVLQLRKALVEKIS